MKAQYSVAFTNEKGEPTKLIGFGSFLKTSKEAMMFVREKSQDARKAGYKGFGKTWDYAAVQITVL